MNIIKINYNIIIKLSTPFFFNDVSRVRDKDIENKNSQSRFNL